jgi:two-component system, NarL family, sensor histidine kinase BarA
MKTDQSQPVKPPSRKGDASFLIVWGFAVSLLIASWSAIFYKIEDERRDELAAVYGHNANLARVFEEHTIRTIQSVDQAILFLRNQYEKSGSNIDIAGYIKDGLIDGNLFVQFGIVNDAGIYSHGTQAGGIGTDVSQRECIQVHMAADTGQLFIGKIAHWWAHREMVDGLDPSG